ncbi:hypothetical protein HGRIS_000453 [Hohenbuehelia grisea]|uniref:Uncharacterized protein n=1 Tax=Hohenbuehelia grisea TaxID=104357 RepID=A0ABR3JR38_9AGAR
MNPLLAQFARRNNSALKEGINIVRKVIQERSSPAGFTTSELYRLALKEKPSSSFIPPAAQFTINPPKYGYEGSLKRSSAAMPHPTHPVHSKKFLKTSILPMLEGRQELKIIKMTRASRLAASQASKGQANTGHTPMQSSSSSTVWVWHAVPPEQRRTPVVTAVAPSVPEDLTHLNKRRRRVRLQKMRNERRNERANRAAARKV